MSQLRDVLTALALVGAMVLAGVVGRRHVIGVAILALLSFVWLTVDRNWEGGVIAVVDRTHGLTTADFVGIVGFVAAAWLWWRLWRRESGQRAAQQAGRTDADVPPRVR